MQTIRALRQARGWTQYDLALRVGVHPQAVYLWEHGRRTPQVAQMRKLGAVFGMCSDDIVLVAGSGHDDARGSAPGATPLRATDPESTGPTAEDRQGKPRTPPG